jgi:hypothetical protein
MANAGVVPHLGAAVPHEALVAFCWGQRASVTIPHSTVMLDAFPMPSSGTVQKCP